MKRVFRITAGIISLLMLISLSAFAAEIPVPNGNFEELAEGMSEEEALNSVPYMWDATYLPNFGHSITLTKEKVYSGKYAMKIVDNSEVNGVLAISYPISVEPGKEYMVVAQVYNSIQSKDGIHLYLEFWSEHQWNPDDLVAWNRSQRVGVSWVASTKKGQWEEIIKVDKAPQEAKYLTITFVGGNALTVISYVDNIKLGVKD